MNVLRNVIIGLTFICSTAAIADSRDDTEKQILTACFKTAAIAQSVIGGDNKTVRTVAVHIDQLALELSKPLPQTYNAVRAGIMEALIHRNSAHEPNAAKATTEERAAVIGLWCINDSIEALDPQHGATLQDAEVQQTLIHSFVQTLDMQ